MRHIRAKKLNHPVRTWVLGSAAGIALIVGGGMAAQATTADHSRPAESSTSPAPDPVEPKPVPSAPEANEPKPVPSAPEANEPEPVPSAPASTEPEPVPSVPSDPAEPEPVPSVPASAQPKPVPADR